MPQAERHHIPERLGSAESIRFGSTGEFPQLTASNPAIEGLQGETGADRKDASDAPTDAFLSRRWALQGLAGALAAAVASPVVAGAASAASAAPPAEVLAANAKMEGAFGLCAADRYILELGRRFDRAVAELHDLEAIVDPLGDAVERRDAAVLQACEAATIADHIMAVRPPSVVSLAVQARVVRWGLDRFGDVENGEPGRWTDILFSEIDRLAAIAKLRVAPS